MQMSVFNCNEGAMRLSVISYVFFAQDNTMTKQQMLFLKAESALNKQDYKRYYQYKHQLNGEPLYPYLLTREIKADIERFDVATINAFLRRYDDTYWAKMMRPVWLEELARRKEWADYRRVYRPSVRKQALQCYYWYAMYQTKQKSQALKAFAQLWARNDDLPPACDKIQQKWLDSRYDTSQIRWQKAKMLMKEGHLGLAAQISQSLSDKHQSLLQAWRNARNEPEKYLDDVVVDYHNHPLIHSIVLTTIKHISASNAQKAARFWRQFKQKYMLDIETKALVKQTIGISLARHFSLDAFDWLNRVSSSFLSDLGWKWRARMAIRFSRWEKLKHTIYAMPADLKYESVWQYWLAKAYIKQDGSDRKAKTRAHHIYQRLSNDRYFYGLLAKDALNENYNLHSQSKKVSDKIKKDLMDQRSVQQVKQLYELDRTRVANHLWRYILDRSSSQKALGLAHLATKWQMPDLAIFAYSNASFQANLKARFPLAFKDTVMDQAEKYGLPPVLIWALIRQESAFQIAVKSWAGAIGLMQLMPSTAEFIAKRYDAQYDGPPGLKIPDTNIKLGTANLDYLAQLFNGNMAMMLAGYNAGQGHVNDWRPEHVDMNPLSWIETMPFRQTRHYLRNVLTYMAIYAHVHQNNKKFHISEQLDQIKPD
jgi:soluble lytic murein transglycosylase